MNTETLTAWLGNHPELIIYLMVGLVVLALIHLAAEQLWIIRQRNSRSSRVSGFDLGPQSAVVSLPRG